MPPKKMDVEGLLSPEDRFKSIVTGSDTKLDNIDRHTLKKYVFLSKYLATCTRGKIDFCYVDTHSGPGVVRFEGRFICGSPLIALKTTREAGLDYPLFFLEQRPDRVALLEKLTAKYTSKNVQVLSPSDANAIITDILSRLPPNVKFTLFFMDPYGPSQLKWETLMHITRHPRKPELILNYPAMGIDRSIGLSAGDAKHSAETLRTIDEFFGTVDWRKVVDKTKLEKSRRLVQRELLEFYMDRLKRYYRYVEEIPVEKFREERLEYYLIYASKSPVGYKIFKGLKDKYLDDYASLFVTTLAKFSEEES